MKNIALTETIAEVRSLLAEKLFIEVDSPHDDLLSSGLLDSLGLVQLLVHIEETFGVRIALDEIEIDDLRSISSIAALVKKQQPALVREMTTL